MEEKKYPTIEDKGEHQLSGYGCMTAEEPVGAVAYAPRNTNSTGIVFMGEEAEKIDRIPLGMFGFYTDDPDEFEKRVAEIEVDMDEVDAGIEDSEKWIQVDDFWAAMRKEHPWL